MIYSLFWWTRNTERVLSYSSGSEGERRSWVRMELPPVSLSSLHVVYVNRGKIEFGPKVLFTRLNWVTQSLSIDCAAQYTHTHTNSTVHGAVTLNRLYKHWLAYHAHTTMGLPHFYSPYTLINSQYKLKYSLLHHFWHMKSPAYTVAYCYGKKEKYESVTHHWLLSTAEGGTCFFWQLCAWWTQRRWHPGFGSL